VIRRHPDIKLLRWEKDIQKLAKQQLQMLTNLWPLLKSGGMLLYATCSIFREENHLVLKKFLQQHDDVECKTPELNIGIDCQPGRQIFPGDNFDGFFYAQLIKRVI
jgi:16S rRNA (cytosine967-C5)-methyltransferase